MAVLINFKICDNTKECGGIAVCPTKALSWSEKTNSIVIDNDKCISCGLCEKECPIGAIRVAKTSEEYDKIKSEIDRDERTTKDLFVDRYGAVSISEFFQIDIEEIEQKATNENLTLIEIYNPEYAECLLKSIPIKELTRDLPSDTLYYKCESEDMIDKYGIQELPALLLFKKGNLLGTIDGYFSQDEKNELLEELKKIVNN